MGIPVDVLANGRAQSVGVQGRRMHQVAESAQLLERFLPGGLDLVPKLRDVAPRAGLGSETHEVEVGGDKMLRGRVVQLLRDALALLLLKIDKALRQLLRLLLQRLALGDVRNDADEPRRLAGIGKLERSVDLQPTPRTAFAANSANGVEAAARPHGILQRLLECVGVVRMQIALHELLLAQGPVLVRMSEDLVHTLVLPNRAIRLDLPFEDAKRSSARGDA